MSQMSQMSQRGQRSQRSQRGQRKRDMKAYGFLKVVSDKFSHNMNYRFYGPNADLEKAIHEGWPLGLMAVAKSIDNYNLSC